MGANCLAHVYGNVADHPDQVRRYSSDMTDAEWVAIRPLLPVPAWYQGRGGQPEGYCHRQMLDAIRYLGWPRTRAAGEPSAVPGSGRGACRVRGTGAVGDGLVAEFVARAQAGGVKLTGEAAPDRVNAVPSSCSAGPCPIGAKLGTAG